MSILGHFVYTEQGIVPVTDFEIIRKLLNPRAIFTTQRYMFIKTSDESFEDVEKALITKYVKELKNKENGNKSKNSRNS